MLTIDICTTDDCGAPVKKIIHSKPTDSMFECVVCGNSQSKAVEAPCFICNGKAKYEKWVSELNEQLTGNLEFISQLPFNINLCSDACLRKMNEIIMKVQS